MPININGSTGITGAIDIQSTGSVLSGVVTATAISGVSTAGITSIFVGSGSTSAPAISPSGDSNTGIFFPAADTIAFAEGGIEALRIDSNSNIGIGTISPGAGVKLEVVGGEIKAGRVDSSSEGGQVSFGRATDNATGWYIDVFGNTSTPSLRFVDVSNAVVRASIDGSGRVTMPYQPGFFASGTSAGSNQPATGDADDLGPKFNTTSQSGGFNIGNHYNTTTGVFTAPVSGKYYTFFNMRWDTVSFVQNSFIRIHISINNNNNLIIHQINGSNEAWTSYMGMSCSGIVNLAVGDTLRPKGGMNAGTAFGWWTECSWGAWLLG